MKKSFFVLIIVSLTCNLAFSDRTLSAGEISVILNALTQQPTETWLPAGSISARHLEYSMTEKSICEYRETTHFDGVRFYREITLISSEDEMESDVESAEQKAKDMDRERIFCWDGVTYTQYYKSAAAAIIQSGQNHAPFGTFGPFSAGIIPWGHGVYTLQKLSGCICTAREVEIADQRQIHLQVTDENASPQLQMNFVLDPGKNYAVISHRIEDPQLSGINQSYSQFVQINNRWIPTVITIERFLKKPEGRQVMSYEDWKFEAIKPDVPLDAHFSVKLNNNTLVELHSSEQSKSLMYYVNDQKNIASLLEEKSTFLTPLLGSVEKNCAAAAVQLVTKQFSRPYPASQIETLAAQNSKMTSLYLLKSKLEETGLYCVAVETTLESLRKVNNSQVILHLQDNGHYVILDRIDDENVWTVDLTSRKIYWKIPIQQFLRQWKRGIAIVVSDNPQNLNPEGTPLSVSDQQQIMGGDATGTNYSCTDRIQTNKDLFCSEPIGFFCGGRYYIYWERYGCKEDPNGGFCAGEEMSGHEYTDCITDFSNPGSCNVSGISRLRSIRACQ
jgi:predicted double-glycine peptidase